MSQPQPGEAGGIPQFTPEPVTPLDVRRVQFAQVAGGQLTEREAQIAAWFYQAGDYDGRQAVMTEVAMGAFAAAPAVETNPALTEDTDEHAAVAAPAAEQNDPSKETLGQAMERHPLIITVNGGGHENDTFANTASIDSGFYDALRTGQVPMVGLPQRTVEEAAVSSRGLRKTRREVVGFTVAPDTYKDHLQGVLTDPEQPVVMYEFHAGGIDLGEGRVDVVMRSVLPKDWAERLDKVISKDPRTERRLLGAALKREIDIVSPDGEAEDLPAGAAASEESDELEALIDTEAALERMGAEFDQNKKPTVVVLSNVDGIGGAGASGARPNQDGYVSREVSLAA